MAATRQAITRLTKEYQSIQENPPPYIVAHPSESNILEWHYIITGPENTPYHGGQYWGTLIFPANYPFAPPAIRMMTPSGRFHPSSRLCLSISDFHPRSFNPAWEVSTILMGLLSFMTSEEMTTGSFNSPESERRFHAARSRWWNSTAGGSGEWANGGPNKPDDDNPSASSGNSSSNNKHGKKKENRGGATQKGNVKAGDGGAKFREEWPEVDAQNREWMRKYGIDPATGQRPPDVSGSSSAAGASGRDGQACAPQLLKEGAGSASAAGAQAVHAAVVQQRDAGRGWLARNKLLVAGAAIFIYVLIARLLGQA